MKDERIAAAGALIPIAEELGATPAQLALAWVASNPRISVVLTGATSMAQLQENLGALDVLPKLTPEVLARIDEATGSHKGIDWGRQ